MITTEFVLVETGNFLCRWPSGRNSFLALEKELRESTKVTIIPASTELYARGLALFAARPDKAWSLTDCTSFEVMTELDLTDALTADEHFEQAGFKVLPKL